MRHTFSLFAVASAGFLVLSACSQPTSNDVVTMVGSTTVGPAFADGIQASGQTIATEFDGSGAGVTTFCSLTGAQGPDLLVLDRPFTEAEAEACTSNGVAFRTHTSDGAYIVSRESSLAANSDLALFMQSF